jgi:hypothetical protein
MLSWRVVPRADTITRHGESTFFSSRDGRNHQRRVSDDSSWGQMGDEPPPRELDRPDTPPSDIEREGHDPC